MGFWPLHQLLPLFDPRVRIQWITNRGIISQKVAVAGSAALGVLGYAVTCAPALFISISSVSCRRYNATPAKSSLCFCLQAASAHRGVHSSTRIISHSLPCLKGNYSWWILMGIQKQAWLTVVSLENKRKDSIVNLENFDDNFCF